MPEHTPAPTPARSLYGFFMYLFSKTMLATYCIWAFTPSYHLHYLNIYYYPQKYWATAIPIQCLVALTMFAFFVYPSSNLMLTCGIDSIHSISDNYSQTSNVNNKPINSSYNECVCLDDKICFKNKYVASCKELKENTVPPLLDLDIRMVSRKLYLNRKLK
ncbi:phosphatidylinositol N-acetylglucosaminyltransferase subunit P [Aricia agestis]|uniref:phosphatidylinositol N-acetylglucosaminyltransferase subunit P n=1 Tax=Aricia agestis TaxID=91739 RepID=UPI001C2038CE|nr:phosphatidylinositol N-acetylglucosaminyltransferase subunit P [Aricia agestis]XP_041977612.1 phosphatidylinositol N-acetylglucosaminyltransferase subunit P [Aricia agestis]